ncbi:MAG: amidophosphoribosyltransferase [Bacteroidetes bacterium MedPE-SWsnd-G2]|nr:MAG: amidophosphoribosyltransferase [Bacteroidetes bacterium MedPE-SWsnd-G2]
MKNLLNLFFPDICITCKSVLTDFESFVCLDCRHQLPVFDTPKLADEAIKKILKGRVSIETGYTLLRFSKKGKVQELIHQLKYKGNEAVGEFLGDWMGSELKPYRNLEEIDVVIPVPIHKKKLKERGYNQVEKFGKSIAKELKVPYIDTVLVKRSNTKTQVFKTRLSRWMDKKGVFELENPSVLQDKHILIVDDIITTGSTMEVCVSQLQKIKGVKVSIAAMAVTE